jgi:hypothetical protein
MADEGTVDEKKLIIDTLISEAQALSARMSQLQGSVERFIATAGTITGAGLTLGLFQRQRAILLIMPIVLFILYTYIIQIFTDIASAGGQRRFVEETINESVGCDVFLWCKVGVKHQARLSPVLSTVLAFVVLAVATGVGIWASFHYFHANTFGWCLRILNLVLIIYATFTISRAAKEYFTADRNAFAIASETDVRGRVRSMLEGANAYSSGK